MPAPARPRDLLRGVFAAGYLSGEHVQVVLAAVADLPGSLDVEERLGAERFLVEQAREHDPRTLTQIAAHLRHVLDPSDGDGLAEHEDRRVATRTLAIRDRAAGSCRVRGELDQELTALLRERFTVAGEHPKCSAVAVMLAECSRRHWATTIGS